ncbi:prepilin-type N-terminal cleavage/methylation domain-containing protein [uncultured Cloacibacillus sp.]|uniref:prepilin-type N-terminal cleavage/methylation domain-containing protein n=1 Tax=uncultured Cloacibacillus sp. TaxID=889794 RepID=UPI002638E843|nr:prepilin-type N-terminal cleavage/methylation domain-containing protein [uncultured Cloacibacillus sp.]
MRRPNAQRGFSLAELLCAALALCVLAGAAALSFRDTGERRIVLEEAEELRAWLSSRMAQAAREGAEFKLVIDADKTTQELGFTIEWYGGPRDLDTETYAPGRAAIERDSLANEHTFDGEWFTLTPAASFIIRSRRERDIAALVTVSGVGYVDVKETLKEQ